MTLAIANLPAAVQAAIQDGILERKAQKALTPNLVWRTLIARERHMGRIGEKVTKTRPGLIGASSESTITMSAGSDPPAVTRSLEQYGYQVASRGSKVDIDLPASYVAAYDMAVENTEKLAFHGAQSLGRMARDRIFRAYESLDTFTTDAPGQATTTVTVKSVVGFDTVLVAGIPTAVSVSNPLPVKIGGVARNVTAVDANASTLTISVALQYSKWDRVVANDAPIIVREGGRATDHLLVAGDTASIATFREAKARLVEANVPGIDGTLTGPHLALIPPMVKTKLFGDPEFHNAITRVGLDAMGAFATGALGLYGGLLFMETSEMPPVLAADTDYQTDIRRSIVMGAEAIVEAYIPEADFADAGNAIDPQVAAMGPYYRLKLDPDGVLTLVLRSGLDDLGRKLRASWVANVDYAVGTDQNAGPTSARYKRCVVVHTA